MQRMPNDAEVGESISGEVFLMESVDSFIKFDNDEYFQIVISSHANLRENLVGWNILKNFTIIMEEKKIILIRS